MFLRELYEAKGSVGLIFGRFNPPHKGHRAAWEMASKNSTWYVGTNQSTQGPKDPLPYDVKIKAMETIWPAVAGHIVPHQSWLSLASDIYKKHGDVELRVYTDEDWVLQALNQYNGAEGKSHGFYNFSKITSVPTPRLSSATALRSAVADGNRKAFADAAGVPADTLVDGTPFFDLVAKYLGQYKKEAVEPNELGYQHNVLSMPANTLVIDYGNHRAAAAQRMGKTIKGYFPVKKTTEARTFQPQMTPMQDLVAEYQMFSSFGQMGLSDYAKSSDSAEKVKEVIRTLAQSNKSLQNLDKQALEKNKNKILTHIHDMMNYAIAHFREHLKPEQFDAKKQQINKLLTKYNNLTSTNENIISEQPDSKNYLLQLERDKRAGMLILHILDKGTGKRTEVRGKMGYETDGYDPNDKLHQLLDKVGKSASVSDLMNGDVVSINPRHPDGASAKVAADKAYNENFADSKVKYTKPQFDVEWEEAERYPEFVKIGKAAWIELASKGKAVTIKSAKGINNTDAADPDSFKSLDRDKQARALTQLKSVNVEMPIVAVYPDGWKELIGGNTRLTAMLAQDGRATVWVFKVPDEVAELAENFADGKNPGRKGLAKRMGVNTKASVSSLRKTAKNSSGEKQRMAHWLANMKAGRQKAKKK